MMMYTRACALVAALVLGWGAGTHGAEPHPAAAPVPVPPTRLEQLETTYNELLRGTHLPLLKQYLAELQALQSKALIASESASLKNEIARIQALIAGKGIVELDSPTPAAKMPGKVVRKSGIVFTLEPVDATPLPANATAPDAVVPLGQASWLLSSLPAGSYDVVAHYACPALPDGAKIHIAFGKQEFDRQLQPAHLTKDAKTFRVMRLCQLTLTAEEVRQNVVVTALPAGTPWVFLKQVLIVKSKSE